MIPGKTFLRILATLVLLIAAVEGLGGFFALLNYPDDLAVISAVLLLVLGGFVLSGALYKCWHPAQPQPKETETKQQ